MVFHNDLDYTNISESAPSFMDQSLFQGQDSLLFGFRVLRLVLQSVFVFERVFRGSAKDYFDHLRYFTNWIELICFIFTLAEVVIRYKSLMVGKILADIGCSCAGIFVPLSIAYWILFADYNHESAFFLFLDIFKHGIIAFLMVVDVLYHKEGLTLLSFAFTGMVCMSYFIFSIIYVQLSGNKNYSTDVIIESPTDLARFLFMYAILFVVC